MKELFLLLVAVPAIFTQCLSNDDSAIPSPNSQLTLYNGQQQFTLSMLQSIIEAHPMENIFFSPYSVYNALLLAYFSSANQTEKSIKNTLALPPNETKVDTMRAYVLEKYSRAMMGVNSSKSYEFSSANRLFVSPQQKVRECMEELFKDEIAITDFQKDPKAAVNTINAWVAEKTKNQIKDLLSEGSLTESTQIVLANAAYFKGIWKSKFLPEQTKNEVFYITNSLNAMTAMMRQKSTFNHLTSEKLGAHVLELPYEGENMSMFILLPPFVKGGVQYILKRLTLEGFQEIVSMDTMIPRQVEVALPKFTVEQELELTPVLEAMGIGDLFQPTSDLSGLTGKPGLQLDTAVHKAKISLDEEGTTAAAATAIFNFRSSRPLDPAKFICNHPFIYFIYDRTSKSVLFAGVYNKPVNQGN